MRVSLNFIYLLVVLIVHVFIIYVTGSDDEDTDAAQLMSLPVLLQRSVMAPLLAQ